MESPKHIVIGLELIKSEGDFYRVSPFPTVLCWIRVFHLSDHIHRTRLVILHRTSVNGEWEELNHTLTKDESLKIFDYLKQLGIPECLPEIEGIQDATADIYEDFSLRITFEDKHFYLNLHTSFGEFSGKDAKQLEALFQYIFGLVGLENPVGKSFELPINPSESVSTLDNLVELPKTTSSVQLISEKKS